VARPQRRRAVGGLWPDLFAVRFQDQSNVIFEFLPWQKRRG